MENIDNIKKGNMAKQSLPYINYLISKYKASLDKEILKDEANLPQIQGKLKLLQQIQADIKADINLLNR